MNVTHVLRGCATRAGSTGRPGDGRRGRLLCFLPALLASGCARGEPLPSFSVEEVDSPAAGASETPFLSASGDTLLLSWMESDGRGGHTVRLSTWSDGAWGESRVVARGERLLANWADYPSVQAGSDGSLWAQWGARRDGRAGYDVVVARSADGGAIWTSGWTPHEDGSPTDHGFVSLVPMGGDVGIVWLDGRDFARPGGGAFVRGETALYFRKAGAEGPTGPESVVDPRACDCCRTDAAVVDGVPVVVYRDRTEDEVRDIRLVRWTGEGWSEGVVVHDDGWETGACPINGPAVAAVGEGVVVAWFTGAGGVPRVQVARSSDGGRTFAEPVSVDEGAPAGRVDVALAADGTALVSWLERSGGEGAQVLLRAVSPSGAVSDAFSATGPYSPRVSGFAHLAMTADGDALLAWTDAQSMEPRVRISRIRREGT